MRIEWTGHGLTLIGSIDDPGDADEFALRCSEVISAGHEIIEIEFRESERIFPNARVPIAATVDYYKNRGVHFEVIGDARRMNLATIVNPRDASDNAPQIFDQIWRFNQDSADEMTSRIIDAIQRETQFAKGFDDALNWCLYEIMDNVANHSEVQSGFIEVQRHIKSRRLAICIADAGIGIKTTISQKRRTNAPQSDEDAITLAMRHKTTRDPSLFQGNGLWGLQQIVQKAGGTLTISSGSGQVKMEGASSEGKPGRRGIAIDAPGTVIDFQIDYKYQINMEAILGQPPAVLLHEKFLDDNNRYVMRIASEARGYATRKSGAQMFNKTLNLLKVIPGYIVLDFIDIQIISSSFADEFIGKLVRELGFVGVNSAIRITNTTPNITSIINQSVKRRLEERSKPTQVI